MGKISVQLDAFASEDAVGQAISAANSATPETVTPFAANILRDANGKLISVDVNLPSAAQADLDTAMDAINKLPGVSSAKKYPMVFSANFDNLLTAYPNGASIAQHGDLWRLVSGAAPVQVSAIGSKWVAAPAAESFGGTGSALKLVDMFTGSPTLSGDIRIAAQAPAVGLHSIRGLSFEFKIKRGPAAIGAPPTNFQPCTLTIPLGVGNSSIVLKDNIAWNILLPDGTFYHTSIPALQYVHVSFTCSGRMGVVTIKGQQYHANEVSIPFMLENELDMSEFRLNINEVQYVGSNALQSAVFVDDLEVTILSGV